ncbi:TetR/AcrR family transcriptional regulator [Microbacterium sp. YY-01]|uniref:TetR/AcrR family transcriptional regulator n=1 Tax=Microbacterium sp. YY-01 TaxID=3421634 RepID=UPI003D185A03
MVGSSSSRSRGMYAKTEQFRLDVLDAALRLVAEHGFDAATLQLIADEVGRSKAGVLHHFGSREGLLLELVKHRDAVNRQLFPVGDGFDASLALTQHNQTVPGLIALFTVSSALAAADPVEGDRRAFFTVRYDRMRDGFARRISQAQRDGTVRCDVSAEEAAGLIVAAMDGLQVQWLLNPGVDMVAHLRALIRMLQV